MTAIQRQNGTRRTSAGNRPVAPLGRRVPARSEPAGSDDPAGNGIHLEYGAHPRPAGPLVAPASWREPIRSTRGETAVAARNAIHSEDGAHPTAGHPARYAIHSEDGARPPPARPRAAAAGRYEPIRSACGNTEDAGRNALRRKDGARPPPAARPHAAPATRRESIRGTRGETEATAGNAIHSEDGACPTAEHPVRDAIHSEDATRPPSVRPRRPTLLARTRSLRQRSHTPRHGAAPRRTVPRQAAGPHRLQRAGHAHPDHAGQARRGGPVRSAITDANKAGLSRWASRRVRITPQIWDALDRALGDCRDGRRVACPAAPRHPH
jgi:hypothetical protein